MQVPSLGGEDPWSRAWQPTPVFLPGKFHVQRSLEGYSPWGLDELDLIEATEHTHSTGDLTFRHPTEECCFRL